MSQSIARMHLENPKKRSREQLLGLIPDIEYIDGRTKQSHRDETDIVKIMARFAKTGTVSHLAKHEGVYADFSDFDFHKQTTMLSRGREIFAELPAELRKEFSQSPAAFFAYVNDPANAKELRTKLPGLAAPGRQIDAITPPSADLDAAKAVVKAAEDAASELASKTEEKSPPQADPPPPES